jgi:predicted kinase
MNNKGAAKDTQISYLIIHSLKFILLQFVRINQDELGNRKACEAKAREVLAAGKCPIIDRCNFDWSQRQKWTTMANNHALNTVTVPVDCILLQIPVEDCIRRCEKRSNHETIRPQEARDIVCKVHRQYAPPRGNEEPNLYRSLSRVRDDHAFNDLLMECLNR